MRAEEGAFMDDVVWHDERGGVLCVEIRGLCEALFYMKNENQSTKSTYVRLD